MFRGFCVLIMIEAHVSNATILPSIQKTSGFHYLDLLNGTIAPAFIFVAGFAMALTLDRKWDDFLGLRKPLWLQIRRLLYVLWIGYWLHLPAWSFRRLIQEWPASFLRADVLHLIAVSLLLSLLLALILRNKKILSFALLALAVSVIFTTVFVYRTNPHAVLPAALAFYFDRASLFPLFPWSAYAFLGTVLGLLYLRLRGGRHERILFLILGVAGAAMVVGAFALFYAPWQYQTYLDVARESPRSFMMRFGFVVFVFSCFWAFEHWRKPAANTVLNMVGQQSLLVYAFHLMIVYGWPLMHFKIAGSIGQTLSYLPSFFISALLIALMALAGAGWHLLKLRRPEVARGSFLIFWLSFAAIFLLS